MDTKHFVRTSKITLREKDIEYLLIAFVTYLILGIIFSCASIITVGILCHLCFMFFCKTHGFDNGKVVTVVLLIALIVVVVIYYGYLHTYRAPYYLGKSDDFQSEYYASIFSKGDFWNFQATNYTLIHSYNRTVGNGFVYLLSFVIHICDMCFGYHTMIFRIINVYFLMAASVFVVQSIRVFIPKGKNELDAIKQANLFALIVLFPSSLYITAHTFRDTIVLFVFASLIYDIAQKGRPLLIRTVIYCLIMYLLRSEYCVLIAAIALGVVFLRQKIMWKKVIVGLIGVVALGVGFYFLDFAPILSKVSVYEETLIQADGFSRRIFSLPLFPLGVFARLLYGLISPLPHLVFMESLSFESVLTAWRAVGTCFFVYQLPSFVKSIFRKSWISITALGFLLVVCVSTFTFRHFIIFYPFAIAGAYIEKMSESEIEIKNGIVLSTFGLLAYFFAALIIL